MSITRKTDNSGMPPLILDDNQPANAGRRRFLGGTAAMAGATALTGCIRKPIEHILPHAQRPEDLVPGKPIYYATAMNVGGAVQGLLVESQDGRPTKIEGNPSHPNNNPLIGKGSKHGGVNAWAQAEVYRLYDPDRAQQPTRQGAEVSWDDATGFLSALSDALLATKGAGTAILTDQLPSPTYRALLNRLVARCPEIQLYEHDGAAATHAASGAQLAGVENARAVIALEKADVLLAIDSDLFGSDGDTVKNARLFAEGRRAEQVESTTMNRLYSVETTFSVTGAMADNRLRLRSALIGPFLLRIATELGIDGLGSASHSFGSDQETVDKWVKAVAADLTEKGGRSLVCVGGRQPAAVHALALRINAHLGNIGADKPLRFVSTAGTPGFRPMSELYDSLLAGTVKQLIIIGGNPVMTVPGTTGFGGLMGRAGISVHLSSVRNETGEKATWHLPMSHFLEAWGDLEATDGTLSIQQPLIRPLHGTALSPIEFVGALLGQSGTTGHEWVQQTHRSRSSAKDDGQSKVDHANAQESAAKAALKKSEEAVDVAKNEASKFAESDGQAADAANLALSATMKGLDSARAAAQKAETSAKAAKVAATATSKADQSAFEKSWRRWLHDGVMSDAASIGVTPTWRWDDLSSALSDLSSNHDGLEINFVLDSSVLDGRYSNVGWLQEMPDPMTSLVWENAVQMSPATAEQHSVATGDVIRLQYKGRTVTSPVLTSPGLADQTIQLSLGYGRSAAGRVGNGCGVNVNVLRDKDGSFFGAGATLEKTPRTASLAVAQGRNRQEPRDGWEGREFVRESTLADFKETPDFAQKIEQHRLALMKQDKFESLWEEPNPRDGQQWGMTIDLNSCTGCGACTVACQAENNIPTVGKDEVLNGRELHWIRIDRYFTGDTDNPEAVAQPIACAHCETAPCENVCPVAATAHSPEGLNDMAYNRCIGTRYCANNCPTKVRRFNFFNYAKRNDELLGDLPTLQRNPDVTVRFRGVMEKCTYCVQRINGAKIVAKRDGNGMVPDEDRPIPACEQTCPTQAIVFGDINDDKSAVTKTKKNSRNYGVLEELNIHPRTTYLAKLRNPNPALVS